ncbi:hypothetical protein [Ruania halotolerans]|uniref:hypothetical protein n=1 Tax=Ruania halotolerans TaxID=2897773 RepID=UPI001E4E4DD6|nr:hypothetical protein [Ruania halotolerans]UFU06820.1 hypothetical protein LQF10_01520 [Ruania halotolerans]
MSYPQTPQDPNRPQDPNQSPAAPVPPAGPPQAAQVPQAGAAWQAPPAAPTAPTGGEYGAYGSYEGPSSDKRPGGVTAAAVMTWVGSAILVVLSLIMFGASGMTDELQDAGVPSEMVDTLPVIGGVMLVISIIAIVLAVLAFRRSKVGLYGLIVLGALYVILSIVGMVTGGGGMSLIPIVWIAIVCALLIKNRPWFDQRPAGV